MKPVVLIAANFLREHRWPVLVLFAWTVLTALAAADFGRGRVAPDDVVFYIQQQTVYICVVTAFLAADAIPNERKSRRILLVLSKAISRGRYLLAMVLGASVMAAADALLLGLCGVWLTARAALPSSPVWSMVVVVLAGAVIAATAALFFSTFLNPYLAAAVALLLFCAPAGLHAQRHPWAIGWPGFAILVNVLRFQFHAGWKLDWVAVVIAIFESGVFWAIAAALFRRRDIAVPVE